MTTSITKVHGYNGFKNHSQWNQSLWINNDEGLYSMAKEAVEYTGNRQEAVEYLMMSFDDMSFTHTPDGVKWSKAGIHAALVGM